MIRKAAIVVLTIGAVGSAGLLALTADCCSLCYTYGPYQVGVWEGCVCWEHFPDTTLVQGLLIFDAEDMQWLPRLGYYILQGGAEWQLVSVSIPLWLPLLLFAAYPTIAFMRGPLRRWRRRKRGECVGCGYNLTGNVSWVCPECGTVCRCQE